MIGADVHRQPFFETVLSFGKAPALGIYEGFTEADLDDLFQQRLLV
jgi:hypothetical protein